MNQTKRVLSFGTICFVAFCLSGIVLGQGTVPSSVCSLPVVSTVVLEYPLGSPHRTATLKSAADSVPTVYTGKLRADHTMDSIFVSLDLSGTYDNKPLTSKLNGEFKESRGRVVKVTVRAAKFAGGHHVLDAYQLYTFNAGGQDAVEAFNKDAITLESDISSRSPNGRVYKMTNTDAVLLYDQKDPTKVVAKLYSLENQVE
jgi:hypothetical protein